MHNYRKSHNPDKSLFWSTEKFKVAMKIQNCSVGRIAQRLSTLPVCQRPWICTIGKMMEKLQIVKEKVQHLAKRMGAAAKRCLLPSLII